MGSGVNYAVIVGLWAVVLIPMWLRRHQQSGEARAIDKYRSAMSSLSSDQRSTVRSKSASDSSANSRGRRGQPTKSKDEDWSMNPLPSDVAAQRRRMTMLVLAVLVLGSMVLAVMGYVPLWFVMLPVALLVVFGVVARQQAVAAETATRRERQLRGDEDVQARPTPAEYAQIRSRAMRAHPSTQGVRSTQLPEVRRPATAAYTSVELVVDDEVNDDWSAVSAPLPTYVSAPRASRVPRVIDLTGDWSGEAMVSEARRIRKSDTFSKEYILDEISRALEVDDDAFFDQLAEQTKRSSAAFFDQEAPRAVND
jgi:hypothetical protein